MVMGGSVAPSVKSNIRRGSEHVMNDHVALIDLDGTVADYDGGLTREMRAI
jgi:hypothetical protein